MTETADQLEVMISDRKDNQTPYIATSVIGQTDCQDLNLANKPQAQMMGRPSLLLRTENKYTKIINKTKSAYNT